MLRRALVPAVGLGGAGLAAYSYKGSSNPGTDFAGLPKKQKIKSFKSYAVRGDDMSTVKTRQQQIAALKSEQFDVLVVGAGCTGAGTALDAQTRGLKTACIERGDFSNETSSRSSKLIWGGFKYLQVAFAELLDRKTLTAPVSSFQKFWGEFLMVYECCTERSWLAGQQPHLVHYVPQAVPFYNWVQWPPYFNHPFYALLPILAYPAFVFYDALAGFNAPASYVMGPEKTKEVFPQLKDVLYSAVYSEAMHNDARTGTCIALTAALKGTALANYVEMTGIIYGGPEGATATGIKCKDNISGEEFEVKAKAIVLATGPFLDSIRKMEDPNAPKAVAAAAGCHIVLPGYFTPENMGFAELRNSRGATMYFLPWLGNCICGSTDKKCDATSSPHVTEDEIQYLVNEAALCMSGDIKLRRQDVLSAWQGWRPLYRDPNAPPGAPVSRHHHIGVDETTGIAFICGGKWSTYRAMAEELVDKVVAHKGFKASPCLSKGIKLVGGDGYHDLLHIELVQAYGISDDVARHLVHAYGVCAFAVCEMASKDTRRISKTGSLSDGNDHAGTRLFPGQPFLESEVLYQCRHEYAMSVKDMLTTRMRIAYLNSEAAKRCIPRVAKIMATELHWSKKEHDKQVKEAMAYIGEFGGPIADKSSATMRSATFTDIHEVFNKLDHGTGKIDLGGFKAAAAKLGFPFKTDAELMAKFAEVDTNKAGKVNEIQFVEWWNGRDKQGKKLQRMLTLTAESEACNVTAHERHDAKK